MPDGWCVGLVRAALGAGRVTEANALLGTPWFVSGEVVHGDKRGRTLGYPTANLRLDPGCGLAHGIYAVRVGGDGAATTAWQASAGDRHSTRGTVLLEVFLFDFSGDLYGRTIDVAFIDWIRPERKFAGVEEPSIKWMKIAAPRAPLSSAPATAFHALAALIESGYHSAPARRNAGGSSA